MQDGLKLILHNDNANPRDISETMKVKSTRKIVNDFKTIYIDFKSLKHKLNANQTSLSPFDGRTIALKLKFFISEASFRISSAININPIINNNDKVQPKGFCQKMSSIMRCDSSSKIVFCFTENVSLCGNKPGM